MDDSPSEKPAALAQLSAAAEREGFVMSCDERTGSLLASLAATRPGGRILELGTGLGAGTAWLLDGMAPSTHLITLEIDDALQAIAREALKHDARAEFITADGGQWLNDYRGEGFDLVFADTWPGKFTHLDQALALVRPGGVYIIDDLLPQPGWPDGHQSSVDRLLADLEDRPDFQSSRLAWSSGILLAVRKAA